ncbi:hypothetical protein BV20DRAFT_699736 [Pilatotrama ljubarskyi]|nr:hypothetical protein BV20DRAFT_699736 [Pilatotrama ljubarskyi]
MSSFTSHPPPRPPPLSLQPHRRPADVQPPPLPFCCHLRRSLFAANPSPYSSDSHRASSILHPVSSTCISAALNRSEKLSQSTSFSFHRIPRLFTPMSPPLPLPSSLYVLPNFRRRPGRATSALFVQENQVDPLVRGRGSR